MLVGRATNTFLTFKTCRASGVIPGVRSICQHAAGGRADRVQGIGTRRAEATPEMMLLRSISSAYSRPLRCKTAEPRLSCRMRWMDSFS